MKTAISLLLLTLTFSIGHAQKFPVTADILRQTYLIQTDTLQGSCFLVEVENQEYLVTAKHLFRSNLKVGDSTNIKIIQENKVRSFKAKYFTHPDNSIDIALLKLPVSIKVITPFPVDGQVTLGQDIYFLGFPNFNTLQFHTSGTIGKLPLVKKGIVSGWINTNSYILYFLDGHNNPGFSGGPVICIDNATQKPFILGIISGYYFENKPVKNREGKYETTHVEENSGIIKCYPTAIIKMIIQKI
jgi:hypothetical protein